MQLIPFIDLNRSILKNQFYKLAHLQEHFLTVYTVKSSPEDGPV